jgi:hypothetical protein
MRWSGRNTAERRRLQKCSAGSDSCVHKDKPPGIFDLGERSMRYAAGFCFVAGFVISVIVRIGVVLAHEHFSQPTPWSGM